METVHYTNGTRNPELMTTMPEAPCSLNYFIDLPGKPRIQITGRGLTPSQAISNAQGMEDLLRLQCQPPPPPAPEPLPVTREEQVASILAKGLSKATKTQDLPLVDRLAKAAALVLAGAVEPGNRPGLVTVQSQAEPLLHYDVEDQMCTCPDWTKQARAGHARPCKHLLAVAMWQRLED
jgi:hypothetical protein